MARIHRLKRNFTAGELSELMRGQVENDRYKFGCWQLKNMYVRPQGPVSRREGMGFIYDLTQLVGDSIPTTPPRQVPFIFSKTQRYTLIFFNHTAGAVVTTRVVFGTENGLVEDPLSPGDPYIYEFTGIFNVEKFTYKQSADILFIAQPDRIPIEFKRLAHDEWEANEVVFSSVPVEWTATDGYPEFVDFYEQRAVYLSTLKRPQTAWFTESGDFYSFDKSTPLVESDAITLTFDSGTQNRVVWTCTTNRLLIGTIGDEWAISGTGDQPISFKYNKTARHTNNGGERVKALMVGSVTLFIEYHGRKVNQFIFDYNSDTYDTVDLSILAPHLTDNNSILDWDYQQTPYGVVWCIRDDGAMIGLTMKREHKVTGWHRHDTQGRFLSVCCVPGDREDDVWCVVSRTVEEEEKWYIEKKAPEFLGTQPTDAYFLDSYVVHESETAFTSVSNLGHLEGLEVSILGDGGVMTPRIVTGGAITGLEVPCKKVVIGLPYESVLEPVLLDIPLADGTNLGRSNRITGLDIAVKDSLDFSIGTVRENGDFTEQVVPFRMPYHIAGDPVPLFTGVKEVEFPEGYSSSTRVLVKQSKPLPLTVLYIADIVEALD